MPEIKSGHSMLTGYGYIRSGVCLLCGVIVSKPKNLTDSCNVANVLIRIATVVEFLESIAVNFANVAEGSVVASPLLHEWPAPSNLNFLHFFGKLYHNL